MTTYTSREGTAMKLALSRNFFSFWTYIFFTLLMSMLVGKQVGAMYATEMDNISILEELRQKAQTLPRIRIELLVQKPEEREKFQNNIEDIFFRLATATGLKPNDGTFLTGYDLRAAREWHIAYLRKLAKQAGQLRAELVQHSEKPDILLNIAQTEAVLPLLRKRIRTWWPDAKEVEHTNVLDDEIPDHLVQPTSLVKSKSLLVDTQGLCALTVLPFYTPLVLETMSHLFDAFSMLFRTTKSALSPKTHYSLTKVFEAFDVRDRETTLSKWGYKFQSDVFTFLDRRINDSSEGKRAAPLIEAMRQRLHRKQIESAHLNQQHRIGQLEEEQRVLQQVLGGAEGASEVSSSAAQRDADLSAVARGIIDERATDATDEAAPSSTDLLFGELAARESVLREEHEKLLIQAEARIQALSSVIREINFQQEKIEELHARSQHLLTLLGEQDTNAQQEKETVHQQLLESAKYTENLQALHREIKIAIDNFQSNNKEENELISRVMQSINDTDFEGTYTNYVAHVEKMLTRMKESFEGNLNKEYDSSLAEISQRIQEIRDSFDTQIERLEELDEQDYAVELDRILQMRTQLEEDNSRMRRLLLQKEEEELQKQASESKRDHLRAQREELLMRERIERERALETEKERVRVLRAENAALASQRIEESLDDLEHMQRMVRPLPILEIAQKIALQAIQMAEEALRKNVAKEAAATEEVAEAAPRIDSYAESGSAIMAEQQESAAMATHYNQINSAQETDSSSEIPEQEELHPESQGQIPSIMQVLREELERFFRAQRERVTIERSQMLESTKDIASEIGAIASPNPVIHGILHRTGDTQLPLSIGELVTAYKEDMDRKVLDPIHTVMERFSEVLPTLVQSAMIKHAVYGAPISPFSMLFEKAQRRVQAQPDPIAEYHTSINTAGKQAAGLLRTLASSSFASLPATAPMAFTSSTSGGEGSASSGNYKEVFTRLADRLDENQRNLSELPRRVAASMLHSLKPVPTISQQLMQPTRARSRTSMGNFNRTNGLTGTLLEVAAS